MSATLLRAVMHVTGLVVAGLVFWLLPFSPWINAAIAMAVWMVDGVTAELVFNARASLEEKTRDLRDRTDNPPS